MEKAKLKSLIKRVLTSLILAPTVIGCVFLGYPFLLLLVFLAGALLAWEWATMVPSTRPAFYAVLYTFMVSIAILMGYIPVYFVCLVLALAVVFLKSKGEEHRKLLILGVPYISLGIGSIIWLYELAGYGYTLWFIFVVWAVDVGGYLFGCSLKGPKLAPKISPNKTWSGLIGGMLLSVAASSLFLYAVGAIPQIKFYAILAATIAVIAQIGDLIESAMKRKLGVKDSSDLIPGHGGVFDRIDGLIFAAPFVYVFFRYVFFMI